jgi:hypothetical protein
MTTLFLNYPINCGIPEFAKIMIELMLNDPFDHFLRRHISRIGPHPPFMALLDLIGMLDSQQLQCPYGNYGEGNEGFDPFIASAIKRWFRGGGCSGAEL